MTAALWAGRGREARAVPSMPALPAM
ncbi:hypothetical protein HaLaN_32568, partial [Haematococcus lacustris]